MKWLDRIQETAATAPEGGMKSIMCAGIIWAHVILSVLVLQVAGILAELRQRKPRSSDLELPPQ